MKREEEPLPIHTLCIEKNCKGYLYSHFEYGDFRTADRIPDEEALYEHVAHSYRASVDDGLPLVIVFEQYPVGTRKRRDHRKLKKIVDRAIRDCTDSMVDEKPVVPLVCPIDSVEFNKQFLNRTRIHTPEASRLCKKKAEKALGIPLDTGCLDKSRVVCLGLWAFSAEEIKKFLSIPNVRNSLPYY